MQAQDVGEVGMARSQAETLTRYVQDAFAALREAHPRDRFYFYGLFTTEDGAYVVATAASEEGLAHVVSACRKLDPRRSVEELTRNLRFSAPDSPYHDMPAPGLSSFPPGAKLHDTCFEVLRRLERDGFFGQGAARADVIVNVVYGDMSDERWLEHARSLNPAEAVDRALPFLRLHLPSGNVSQWGARAYQVSAISLSADRSLVAYSGSGGEVGVLSVASRMPIYEKRLKGEHWACAISPDGSRLFLGDKNGIGVLDVRSGKSKTFVKMGKPASLALSPRGDRLAVSSWDAPLRGLDVQSAAVLWTRADIRKAALAYSSAGDALGVAYDAFEGKRRISRLACIDTESGRERWSVPLEPGVRSCLAWVPDRDEILAVSSPVISEPDSVGPILAVAASDGSQRSAIPRSMRIEAMAVSPSGALIAIAVKDALLVMDSTGAERGRGTGTQESLLACVFVDEHKVLAVGRDVNCGPAILELTIE